MEKKKAALLPNHVTIAEYVLLKIERDQRKTLQRKSVYNAIADGRIDADTVGRSGSITLIDWDKYKDVTFNT
jgi:hypothetical protein